MVVAVIPARYASTRFPGKPLVDIWGKSMLQRVWERVCMATSVKRVVIATDDERIYEHARSFGAEVIMTRADHRSGTDRCAEAVAGIEAADIVLNIQGDEPFVQPDQINLLVRTLREEPECPIATLVKRICDQEELFSPNVVKAVFSERRRALYFSRHPIPFVRGAAPETWLAKTVFYKHIGMYAFRRSVLLQLAQLPDSPLEQAESLEQLRWLAHGYDLAVGITEQESISIDTPEDLQRLLATLKPADTF
ncbi:MAG: 3-deoxy-manno-octulosonate cytidylyltransferase [Saprospiraceae bacterium]|nr:3-deoxy-manno-octulosonate cytidylyltransferase [Saprospiraceae bacterium]MDW8483412.1 3-deoxy-manno-octulosonate cytidylyltransferase [Saprospiraceae bacterium]